MTSLCYISPVSIHSIRYLEAFRQKGYKTSIITDSNTWIAPEIHSMPRYNLPLLSRTNFPKRFIPNTQTAMRILKNVNPDLVHLHAQYHYGPTAILAQKPFVLTSWGTEVLTLPNEILPIRILAKATAMKAGKVTVDAQCLKDIWIRLGIPSSNVEVIPFGVDLKVFNPKVDGSKIREKLAISKKDIVLISTRSLRNHHYNVECLVRAIPSIIKSCDNVKFIIKGSGPLENYFRNLVKKLNISENVRFVGMVPHAKLAEYLAASDIYVSTCYVDSTSVSLLEAMACGLAPVVTDIAGNREWIIEGQDGFLFSPMNQASLAEKTIRLIKDDGLRKLFGERCYKKIAERARWEDCVAKMERIYQSILEHK